MFIKAISCILIAFSLFGCSAKMRTIITASTIGGVVGAGLGYTVLHHGSKKEFQTQNTVIAASVLAATFGLATWYHLHSLEEQRIELAGRFSRATYLDRDSTSQPSLGMKAISLGKNSIKLDNETRWVLPEFQQRILPPQRSENEIIAAHHTWEIARPGFFMTKDQDPDLFKDEEK